MSESRLSRTNHAFGYVRKQSTKWTTNSPRIQACVHWCVALGIVMNLPVEDRTAVHWAGRFLNEWEYTFTGIGRLRSISINRWNRRAFVAWLGPRQLLCVSRMFGVCWLVCTCIKRNWQTVRIWNTADSELSITKRIMSGWTSEWLIRWVSKQAPFLTDSIGQFIWWLAKYVRQKLLGENEQLILTWICLDRLQRMTDNFLNSSSDGKRYLCAVSSTTKQVESTSFLTIV